MARADLHQHSPYGELVGTEILRSDAARGEIEVAYDAHAGFANRIGTIAGAMIAGLLDSATGLAANLDLPVEMAAVHQQLNVEYLRPAAPGRIVGTATVEARSERERRVRGELHDADGNHIASALATLRVVRLDADGRRAPASEAPKSPIRKGSEGKGLG